MLTMSPDLDTRSLEGLLANDEEAITQLLERYWARSYRVALQFSRDPGEAEDIAQETFVAVLRNLPSLQRGASFQAWFFKVLSNTAHKHHRSRTRRSAHEARSDLTPREFANPREAAERGEQAELVRAHLQELSPKLRHALALRYLEGLSLNEVAEVLEVPRQTASSRIRLGLEALRTSLEPALSVGAALTLAALPELIETALRVTAPEVPAAGQLLAALGDAPTQAPQVPTARAGRRLGLGLIGAGAVAAVFGIAAALLTDDNQASSTRDLSSPAQTRKVAQASRPTPDTGVGARDPGDETRPSAGSAGPKATAPRALAGGGPRATPELAATPAEATAPARPRAEVSGRVLDSRGEPIPFAKVIAVVPAPEDMRDLTGREKLQSVVADSGGWFTLPLSFEGAKSSAALDVRAKGYGTIAGAHMGGGSSHLGKVVTLTPGSRKEVELRLPPMIFVGGRVVDEEGKPLGGVKVTATLGDEDAYGYVSVRETGLDGRFAVYDYPVAADNSWESRAQLVFEHPQRQRQVLEDAYALQPFERGALEVVLRAGATLTGRVVDARGAPLAGVLVAVDLPKQEFWRGCRSSESGTFRLEGLPTGEATLRFLDLEGERKAVSQRVLVGDLSLGDVVLAPLRLGAIEVDTLLGMKVATLTPELSEAYELGIEKGVLVLDPGPDAERLGVGRLKKGDVFWSAGKTRKLEGVEAFVRELLANSKERRVRVVYSFRRTESGWMSNTQTLEFSAEDLRLLRERLPPR